MLQAVNRKSTHTEGYYLAEKNAKTTLEAFKSYHAMAERQTAVGRNCGASGWTVEGNFATNFGKPIVRSLASFMKLCPLTCPNPMVLLNVLAKQSLNMSGYYYMIQLSLP